ncbi:hypothetical protein ADIARSV_3180 [Arcticibacter svalbardensis MN12-7]|uniref:Uncharacterized protein n=1 Tax=Arcticibacter svalbardensis MN12-7 TaxID=1150600 RepID=R9GPP3_9SPHI|nr:hypothetical protein ADIARSV_3180 [Arcticibacter svalbardensis MN12-7]
MLCTDEYIIVKEDLGWEVARITEHHKYLNMNSKSSSINHLKTKPLLNVI